MPAPCRCFVRVSLGHRAALRRVMRRKVPRLRQIQSYHPLGWLLCSFKPHQHTPLKTLQLLFAGVSAPCGVLDQSVAFVRSLDGREGGRMECI